MIPRTFSRNFLARGVQAVVQQPSSMTTISAAIGSSVTSAFDLSSPRSQNQITSNSAAMRKQRFSSLSEPAYLNRPYKEVPTHIGEVGLNFFF